MSAQKFYTFGGKRSPDSVVDVYESYQSSCNKAIKYPKAIKGFTAASMTVEKTTVVCGGDTTSGKTLANCYRLADGSWIPAGNFRIPRLLFTITPLTRRSFLAYGNNW